MVAAGATANCVSACTRTPSSCLGSIASPIYLPNMDLAIMPHIRPGLALLVGGPGSSLGPAQ